MTNGRQEERTPVQDRALGEEEHEAENADDQHDTAWQSERRSVALDAVGQ